MGGVLDVIKSSLNSQIRKLTGFVVPLICRFSLPLGEEGLLRIGHNAFQVESKSSIIVCDGEFIYKCIIDEVEDKQMLKIYFLGTGQEDTSYQNNSTVVCVPYFSPSKVKEGGKKMPSSVGTRCC